MTRNISVVSLSLVVILAVFALAVLSLPFMNGGKREAFDTFTQTTDYTVRRPSGPSRSESHSKSDRGDLELKLGELQD